MSTETAVRNRFKSQSETVAKSAEELLIERLDVFLSLIEHRLHSFETYFQLTGSEENEESKSTHSRRASTVLMLQMKHFSRSKLNKVYEQLLMVKDLMLRTSIQNLDFLYKTLDDKYNDLFDQDGDESVGEDRKDNKDSPTVVMVTGVITNAGASHRELLTKKIMTNLLFFEEKLLQIDAYVKSKTPLATDAYEEDAKFSRFRFFNFNKALKIGQTKYLHYYQLPLSWRENRYIINGYRFSLSHGTTWKSIVHFNHNETLNIWIHLLGGIFVCYLALVHYPSTAAFARSSLSDNVIMTVFIVAALKCLISSVLWHTYSTFAQINTRNRFACVDYTGITVLVTCSVISAEYYSLYNHPKLLMFSMTLSIAAGIGGFAFNWSSYFDRPDCRPLRIGFYVCLAASGATSFLFKWYHDGLFSAVSFCVPLIYRSFVWYCIGVIFYGGLIPERWRYDVVVHEDQTCNHAHSAREVLMGEIENSGEEELQNLFGEIRSTDEARRTSVANVASLDSKAAYRSTGVLNADRSSTPNADDSDEVKYKEILEKHFPERPNLTPYHSDFLSLWWVDYVFQSHNLWHLFVVLGVVGHYFCLVDMLLQSRQEELL